MMTHNWARKEHEHGGIWQGRYCTRCGVLKPDDPTLTPEPAPCEQILAISNTHQWEKSYQESIETVTWKHVQIECGWICKRCGWDVSDTTFPPMAPFTCEKLIMDEALR